jgi:hypothetical protein
MADSVLVLRKLVFELNIDSPAKSHVDRVQKMLKGIDYAGTHTIESKHADLQRQTAADIQMGTPAGKDAGMA